MSEIITKKHYEWNEDQTVQAIADYYTEDTVPAWTVVGGHTEDFENPGHAWFYLDGPVLEITEENGPATIHARIEDEVTIPEDGGPATIIRTGYVVMGNLDEISPENALRVAEHLMTAVALIGTP